jgi:hypothetical protein
MNPLESDAVEAVNEPMHRAASLAEAGGEAGESARWRDGTRLVAGTVGIWHSGAEMEAG